MERWLLLDDGPARGALNMATDELLLGRAAAGAPPVLRLYSFDPPAITIGWHQDPAAVLDLAAARADGIEVARRITGGRALLHAGEVTYCLAAPLAGIFAGGLQETFLAVAGAVAAALRALGVPARVSGGRRRAAGGGIAAPCLAGSGRYEITAGGRKIAGSAQRRARGAFLQHGSILLERGSERIVRYLRRDWGDLAAAITTVADQTRSRPVEAEARRALEAAFSGLFGSPPARLRLADEELEALAARAAELAVAGGAPNVDAVSAAPVTSADRGALRTSAAPGAPVTSADRGARRGGGA